MGTPKSMVHDVWAAAEICGMRQKWPKNPPPKKRKKKKPRYPRGPAEARMKCRRTSVHPQFQLARPVAVQKPTAHSAFGHVAAAQRARLRKRPGARSDSGRRRGRSTYRFRHCRTSSSLPRSLADRPPWGRRSPAKYPGPRSRGPAPGTSRPMCAPWRMPRGPPPTSSGPADCPLQAHRRWHPTA